MDHTKQEVPQFVRENDVKFNMSDTGIMLLVKGELADEVAHRVEQAGVMVVPKPLSRALFYQALLVDREKYALMAHQGLTEPQAHRFIEKQAMDKRCAKGEIAESILQTYGA